MSASGGTNIITGNTAFTGGGGFRFYLADGDFINGCKDTLIIQPGATLTVTGNYDDSGVIGRDSSSGVLIQNGGTFNFAIGNNPYLIVGTSGSTNTRLEYDMNGGLFYTATWFFREPRKSLSGFMAAHAEPQSKPCLSSSDLTNFGSMGFGSSISNSTAANPHFLSCRNKSVWASAKGDTDKTVLTLNFMVEFGTSFGLVASPGKVLNG